MTSDSGQRSVIQIGDHGFLSAIARFLLTIIDQTTKPSVIGDSAFTAIRIRQLGDHRNPDVVRAIRRSSVQSGGHLCNPDVICAIWRSSVQSG